MNRSICVVLFLMFLLSHPLDSEAANPCFSALDGALTLHIPALAFGTQVYEADLAYSSSGPDGAPGVWFKLNSATFGVSPLTSCSNPARLFLHGGTVLVASVPMVVFGSTALWADLQYIPTTDGDVWLLVSNAGLMPNQVFVTSTTGNGNLSTWANAGGLTGLAAGDAICQGIAAGAGLPGTYRAWLSDNSNDAYCRISGFSGKKSANCGQAVLPAGAGPWVRTDGFPFGSTLDQIVTNSMVYAPAATDESGVALVPGRYYFTSTAFDGTLIAANQSCSGMTDGSDAGDSLGGYSMGTGWSWTQIFGGRCSGAYSLLCFQLGEGPALPPFSHPGKKVFLSTVQGDANLGGWPDAGGAQGLAAGDAICRSRATAAGLPNPGSYKAWLSSSTVDARDRLFSDGPWVRVDGVLVAQSKADLTDGTIFAPINLTEEGVFLVRQRAWTGTLLDGTKQAGTCGDWTEISASESRVGVADDAGIMWTDWNTIQCLQSVHLYCFED